MTSELMILTPSAVVLAADSTITIDNKKTYIGVNKLFKLSDDMGAMIYNNAEFLNVPLETLIKEFGKVINENDYPSLDEIKDSLESFLTSIVNESEYKISFDDLLGLFIEDIKEDLSFMSSNELEDFLIEEMKYFNFDDFNGLFEDICLELDKNEDVFDNVIPEDLDSNQRKSLIGNFKKFFVLSMFIEDFTGISVAGFERENLFPSYIHFRLIYLYDDKFVLDVCEKGSINGDLVIVKPFAEDDVINTFLTSIDLSTQNEILGFLESNQKNLLDLIVDRILDSNVLSEIEKNHILGEIANLKSDSINFQISFSDFINDLKNNEKESMFRNIYHLPNGDLANLAESLINITSLKRRIQDDLESVGGPVDVAIITKGDGFKWTKHKDFLK